jgi:hypothetical protein
MAGVVARAARVTGEPTKRHPASTTSASRAAATAVLVLATVLIAIASRQLNHLLRDESGMNIVREVSKTSFSKLVSRLSKGILVALLLYGY